MSTTYDYQIALKQDTLELLVEGDLTLALLVHVP